MGLCRLALGIVCLSPLLAAPDAEALYKERCAACHDNATDRIPPRSVLAGYRPEIVIRSLTTGTMREHGKGMSDEDKQAMARFVTGKELGSAVADLQPKNLCAAPPPAISLTADSNWNGWGRDLENTRFHPKPGLKAEDVPKLKVKWAFAFPNARYTYGQPTVIGDRLYITSAAGTVYALNARSGCLYWTFEAGNESRTAITVGALPAGSPARFAAYFGDDKANVYAIDADTGTSLWKTRVDEHPVGRVTGAPILYKDKLYVPVSSVEEAIAQNLKYECCKFRGAVAALDARTGKLLWKTHTITDPPKPFKKNSAGTQMYGPAGAAVWSAPTVDTKRGLIYVGTGNSYTDVETATANAIVAIDMETGSLKWVNQATPRDNFIMGCPKPGVGNCPENEGPDVDFGSSPVLRSLARGKQVLLAGQKSGEVYGLDPDNRGKILWQRKVGEGSALGGVEWGFAADGEHAYVAIADVFARPPAKARPGIAALKIATGEQVWFTPAPKAVCSWGTSRCLPSQSQAVTAIPGAVFSGSMDGRLRAYSAKDGSIVWDFDTGVSFETVNGVAGQGGSLDGAGPTVSNGMLFVTSGYGRIVGRGGNVLLAFSVDGK